MSNELLGPSIQIDPSFPYYLNRSAQSIADELSIAGYRVVHFFVTNETKVNAGLLETLKKRGFGVWATVFGNGTYTTDHLPKDWPDWQMTLLKPVNDGYFRLSPFSCRYVAWKKQALAGLVRTYPFDGLEIAEPYFPEWNGLSSRVYGDVGPYARAAFKQQYGSDIPDFKHPSSPLYYRKNKTLYNQWIEFRVTAVNRFLHEIYNGKGGVREARPDIRIATWSLGIDAGPDSVQKLREYQGLDAPAMISYIRPDVHFIQTHWPDWMRWKLPPDYAKHYEPFAAKIRALHPALPLGLQTDIGSHKPMRRSREWLAEFARTSDRLGYKTWTAYEYHLGKYMYDEKPVPMNAVRLEPDTVRIQFQKRVDAQTAGESGNYTIMTGGKQQDDIHPDAVQADGGNVTLRSSRFPQSRFRINIRNVTDTPELWLYPQKRGHEIASPCVITIEAWDNTKR